MQISLLRRFESFCRHFNQLYFKLRAGGTEIKTSPELTAVIYTVEPSHLFEKCLASVQTQTLRPAQIEIVRNVAPVSRAAQEGLERVQTPFYISVDEDMILYPHCFQRLYQLINKDEKRAEVVLALEDPILGPIFGIQIYRSAAAKAFGFYPLEDKGWDRLIRNKLESAGYECIHSNEVVGQHHPVYLPHEAFWKYRFIGEKIRYYGTGLTSLLWHVDRLCLHWQRTRDEITLYAFAGLFDGLQSEDFSLPLSYEKRINYPMFLNLQDFIERFSNMTTRKKKRIFALDRA